MSKKKQKNKLVKADDYYNDGFIELARYGKIVHMRNLLTSEQFNQMQQYYVDEYPLIKKRIDTKVKQLKDKISVCAPLSLLKFTKDMSMLSHITNSFERDYMSQDNMVLRAQEYIQCILVSTDNYFSDQVIGENQEKLWHSVLADIEDLYKEFDFFYHYWSATNKDSSEISNDMIQQIVESQMLYLVRGNRYQFIEFEPLRSLLPPHNDVLLELFGVSAEEIIGGLENLQYSLSQGVPDSWMDMMQSYDKFCELVDSGTNPETAIEEARSIVRPIAEKVFGEALNDVSHVTGWDVRLIESLTLGIGECKSFFNDSEFSGWPIAELPTKRKPFIKINGVTYSFNYYSLFDNIYRSLQKEIFRLKPDYVDLWSKRQNLASEELTKNIFLKLLPGATIYTGNYYPIGKSLKRMNENDILILYKHNLFVIEVKAGSFPSTPPITDFHAHIKAYKKLAEEADTQCSRTIKYISEHQPALFFDNEKNKKFEINTASDFNQVYSFSVTIENFNHIAARAEKLNFINLSSKTIVISYDDLLVYANYFDSPIYFLHYLKQRKVAIDIPQISMRDELDHLGMYINHNIYSITASELPAEHLINWEGYRKDLDEYFGKLFHPELDPIKPLQEIPNEIIEIIKLLEQDIDVNKVDLAHFLLDMSLEAKQDFCNYIHHALRRQTETGRMLVVSGFGEIKYCLFVEIPEIRVMNMQERQDYVLSAVLSEIEKPIMWINLVYDLHNNLVNVNGNYCTYESIPKEDIERLKELAVKFSKSRIEGFQRQHQRKVGRNDYCPCGSGKKYKRCCIDI